MVIRRRAASTNASRRTMCTARLRVRAMSRILTDRQSVCYFGVSAAERAEGLSVRYSTHRTMAVVTSVRERLDRLFQQRIVIFDGSMGVMLQHQGLSDDQFRGERFRDHPKPLRNNSDVLCLTQPELVTQVHRDYLEAGADIITTNTFTATRVSQADYGLEGHVHEMNLEGARLARRA